MRGTAIILGFLFIHWGFAQTDSLSYIQEDSIIPVEEFPNYFGINVTPMITTIVGNNNKDIKLAAVYKRNFGDKNLRVSLNYITVSNPLPYDSYKIASTTDSSYDARYFSNQYKTFDARFGFEELRGNRFSRLHVGADLIIGYGKYNHQYYSKTHYLDSASNFTIDKTLPAFDEGSSQGEYIDLGVDISFGFDWFMSDQFLFTFQITPQFNYFILNSKSINDPLSQLPAPNNFADFKIGFFDVFLIHKF